GYDRFVRRYQLDDKQKEEAQKRFQQRKAQTVRWMLHGKVAVPPLSSFGPAEPIERTVPEWLETYQAKLAEAEQLEKTELRKSKGIGYERQVADKVRDLKDEANRIRAALRGGLDEQTKNMHEALGDLLTDEQWERGGPLPRKSLPWPSQWSLLGWADFLVAWGLTIIGAFLILGLFTRTTCVAGALLVLSFYLAMPPWPGLPENPKPEGHYLIINNNIADLLP